MLEIRSATQDRAGGDGWRAAARTVPELIAGATIADLIASIAPAQAAYSRVAESMLQPAVTVPAGGNTPVLVEADALPTSEKIRRGLAAINRKG